MDTQELTNKDQRAGTGKKLLWIIIILAIVGAGAFAVLTSKKSQDSGGSATKADTREQFEISCQPPDEHQWYRTDNTFVINPKNPDIMYVNVEWKGFFKSSDGGETWTRKVNGIFTDHIDATTKEDCFTEFPAAIIDPDNPDRILLATAGSPGTLNDPNSRGGGIYETTNGGESWQQRINETMNVYTTHLALAFKPGDTNTYYYGTSAAPASYDEADQNKIFVTKGLIYKTTDNGATWEELPTGFLKNTRLTSIIIDPKNPDRITAGTAVINRQQNSPNEIAEEQMGILQSTDGGKTWQRIDNLPKGYEAAMEMKAASANSDHMFMIPAIPGGERTPKAFYSLDGGKTWQESGNYMDMIAYDPFDPTGNRLIGYLWGACQGVCAKTLYESTDAGKTWRQFGTLPGEIENVMDIKTRLYNLVWHPTDAQSFFLTGASGLVWKTTDNGQTWTTLLSLAKLP